MSSLLKSQVEHLREAESKLPLRYRSDVYVNAIKTEGEAARYIRDVTKAIHEAHKDAEGARRAPQRKRVIEIAAVEDKSAERNRARKKKTVKHKKKSSGAGRRKK